MGKRIDLDGKSYRMRRGKLVEIPQEWLGKITTAETIRQRRSKLPSHKLRRLCKIYPGRQSAYPVKNDPHIKRLDKADIGDYEIDYYSIPSNIATESDL